MFDETSSHIIWYTNLVLGQIDPKGDPMVNSQVFATRKNENSTKIFNE